MNWLIDRLKEGSTWRGIILLLTVCGMKLEPDQQEAIIAAGLAVVGLIGIFTKDKANATDHHSLPPIKLQGQSESVSNAPLDYPIRGNDTLDTDRDGNTGLHQSGYRLPMQSNNQSQSTGWNG